MPIWRPNSTPEIQTFYKAYKAAYGTEPENAFAALGYDTVGLVADAIKRAKSTRTRARSARRSPPLPGYKGITGSISYPPGCSRAGQNRLNDRRQGPEAVSWPGEVTPSYIAQP